MDEETKNAEIVRRYLRVFETGDVAELSSLVADNVTIRGAGATVRGRSHVEGAVQTPGLSRCRVHIEDLQTHGDRVTVAFALTYRHDRTDRDLIMTGVKTYRLSGGKIVQFWGETDLYGLLRQAGLVPHSVPSFD